MGTFADTLEDGILDHIFQNAALTIVAPIEIALWVGDPTDAGTGGIEAGYTNYARQTIAFDAAATRLLNQTSKIDFPQCGVTGQAGITHYSIFDSTATPQLLATGALTGSIDVVNGNTPSIAAGQCDISLGNSCMSDYLANLVLDFVFRGQAFAQPTIYAALSEVVLGITDTTLVGKECPNANAYARVAVAAWSVAALGTTDNDAEILFPTPTGAWATTDVVASALCDSGVFNSGNMLFFDNGITDQPINNGDTVHFIAGAFDITLT